MLLTTISVDFNIIAPFSKKGDNMEMQYSEQDNDIRIMKLSGRLDILGTGAIETKFVGYSAGKNPRVVVDLAEWTFLPPSVFVSSC